MSFVAAFAFTASFAVHPVIEVPSGQPLELYEVLVDEVGAEAWVRFRFLAPDISRLGGTVSFADAEGDLAYLCAQVALPYLSEFALSADVVAVTLLDRPVEFGQSDPDATQFIDVFRVTSGSCIWEGL
ncbi:hypothetical protein KX928_07140 [Roseobacter sp. YSTF-M11]|uniref:Acetolactate synthase n=1 Tax=Roseobacter insulae TaxID=2859783 RepID=A0A9X1FTV4_9RHOB|nr:DUF6497 family protein [Roseobacter insulae]MBW4707557.1 hypothetical protein [Roseobacter insulae]